MISAAIPTHPLRPRRKRSAVRRYPGYLRELPLLSVGADDHIGPLLRTTCVAPVGRGDFTPPPPGRTPPLVCFYSSVGGGLRPAPPGQGPFHTNFPCFGTPLPPRRGGPMCPPANGSRKEPSTGRHIGRPLQNLYQLLENRAGTEACPCLNTGDLPQRASGRRPLRPGHGPEHGSHQVPDSHQRIMPPTPKKEEAEIPLPLSFTLFLPPGMAFLAPASRRPRCSGPWRPGGGWCPGR